MLPNNNNNKLSTLCASVLFLIVIAIGYQTVDLLSASTQDNPALPSSDLKITHKVQYWTDSKDADSISAQKLLDNKWQGQTFNDIPASADRPVYWLRLTVKSTQSTRQVLVADNPLLKQFELYQVAGLSENKQQEEISLNYQGNALELPTPLPHFNLGLTANQKHTFVVKMQSAGPPKIPLQLISEPNFNRQQNANVLLAIVFVTIIVVMALYNLVLFRAVKDPIYLIYVSYLLTTFALLASVNGFGYYFFSTLVQAQLIEFAIQFHYLFAILMLVFAYYFLAYHQQQGKLQKLTWLMVIVLGAMLLISFALPPQLKLQAFFALQPFCYLLAIAMVLRKLRNSFSWTKYYAVSWLPLLAGGVIQPLTAFDLIEYSFITRNAFLLGVIAEIILMSFALAERMRRYEQAQLHDMLFHRDTQLPRRITVENTIESRHQENDKLAVLVVKPEQIERVSLYLSHDDKRQLLKRFCQVINDKCYHDDNILALTSDRQKVATLDNSCLALVVNFHQLSGELERYISELQEQIKEQYYLDNLALPLSAFVGVALYPEHSSQAKELVNQANIALEQAAAKASKWQYYQSTAVKKNNQVMALIAGMHEALNRGDFELYHQPQIDLKTLRVCGSECLIRWRHPEQGEISPAVFMPIAEDTGLIKDITRWVIKTAIKQHKTIIEKGHHKHFIAVNISGKDVCDPDFFNFITDLVIANQVAPETIALEITESVAILDNCDARAQLASLIEFGFILGIDDFGTGYSSIAYMSEIPCHELKIDRQFVEKIAISNKHYEITKASIQMAKGLGLEVVAEGVNSERTQEMLRDLGCDIGQGHYYATAMPLSTYLIWLDEQINGQLPKEVIIADSGNTREN